MKKIFILTGEASGDKLASKVINQLQKKKKDIIFMVITIFTILCLMTVEETLILKMMVNIQIYFGYLILLFHLIKF